jgi:TonB family protein
MENIPLYLLKSACWISGFALVYLIFLQNERFFVLNRIFLVSGIILSLTLPLISFHYQVEIPVPQQFAEPVTDNLQYITTSVGQGTTTVKQSTADFRIILSLIYIAGIVLISARALKHFYSLYAAARRSNVIRRESVTIVRSPEFPSSFSFFNFVFVNPSVGTEEVEQIMNHELVHVRQKHWFDLLLAGFVRTIQWANPFAWIYIRFIRLNHEFLADEAALQRTPDPAIYKAALINQMLRAPVFSLSNSFSYSLSKKRFDMMKKIISSPYRKLRVLTILPVCAALIYAFATPEYNYVSSSPDLTGGELMIREAPVIMQKEVKGLVLNEEGKPLSGILIVRTGIENARNQYLFTTGIDGSFSLAGLPDKASLQFSGRGYLSQTLTADLTNAMTVRLQKDPNYKPPVPPSERPVQLAVVDGVVSDKTVTALMAELSNNVASFKNIEPKDAVAKYGEKAKAGAVEIITAAKAKELGLAVPFRRSKPEDFPTFRGERFTAFNSWVISQVKYPAEAVQRQLEGWVSLSFKVQPDGLITDIVNRSSADKILSDAVVKVIQSSPKWEPSVNPDGRIPFDSNIDLKFVLPDQVVGEAPFVVVEQMPEYPGGDGALLKFIAENTQYPEAARAEKITGRVIVRFVVSKEGYAEGASVLKGVHPLLDAEALRVVNMLSGFRPGYQGGQPVNVWYMVPITFALAETVAK